MLVNNVVIQVGNMSSTPPLIAEYDSYTPFWEMIYRDKKDDFPFYSELARRTGSPILDVGCGTARMGMLLAQEGHEVFNLDISQGMLDFARQKFQPLETAVQQRLHLIHQDMRNFNLSRTFPLIISTFSTLFAVRSVDDFSQTATSVFKHLEDNRMFAFDVTFFEKGKYKVWGSRQIEDNSPRLMKTVTDPNDARIKWIYTRIVAVDDKLHTRKIIAFFDRLKDSVVIERRVFELSNIYLSPVEIKSILTEVGFRKVIFYGGFDCKPLYHPSYKGKQRQIVLVYK